MGKIACGSFVREGYGVCGVGSGTSSVSPAGNSKRLRSRSH
jgi:hypothetical protein